MNDNDLFHGEYKHMADVPSLFLIPFTIVLSWPCFPFLIKGVGYFVIYYLHYSRIYTIKLIMFNNNIDIGSLLKQLGQRLKEARLSRNESQELFAQRLGITRQSYSRMEKGSPQTLIGNWLAASSLLGRLDEWNALLAEKDDLFAKFEKKTSRRQRAGGKRKRKI